MDDFFFFLKDGRFTIPLNIYDEMFLQNYQLVALGGKAQFLGHVLKFCLLPIFLMTFHLRRQNPENFFNFDHF